MFKGLKQKFSKKMVSILFLLAALLIALFLGSYNFLVVNSTSMLPHIMEPLDNMKNTTEASSGNAPVAAASPAASNSQSEQVSKILAKYMEKNTTANSPVAAAPVATTTTTTTP